MCIICRRFFLWGMGMLQRNIFLMATNAFSERRPGGASNWEHGGSPGLPPPPDGQVLAFRGGFGREKQSPASPHPACPAASWMTGRIQMGVLIAFWAQPWGSRGRLREGDDGQAARRQSRPCAHTHARPPAAPRTLCACAQTRSSTHTI